MYSTCLVDTRRDQRKTPNTKKLVKIDLQKVENLKHIFFPKLYESDVYPSDAQTHGSVKSL